MVLAGTTAFLATDKRIERQLPGTHLQLYQNASNIALGGLAASLAGLWAYGLKTENPHLREIGTLELEAVSNTFLIYAPMQFIAGRQRPGEGDGNGDFLNHHALDTAFPSGHAIFIWSMASVLRSRIPEPMGQNSGVWNGIDRDCKPPARPRSLVFGHVRGIGCRLRYRDTHFSLTLRPWPKFFLPPPH